MTTRYTRPAPNTLAWWSNYAKVLDPWPAYGGSLGCKARDNKIKETCEPMSTITLKSPDQCPCLDLSKLKIQVGDIFHLRNGLTKIVTESRRHHETRNSKRRLISVTGLPAFYGMDGRPGVVESDGCLDVIGVTRNDRLIAGFRVLAFPA